LRREAARNLRATEQYTAITHPDIPVV
jgi:hypothetical protein